MPKKPQLTAKQRKAIEALAMCDMELNDVARHVGVSRDTLWRWRKDPMFQEAVVERARELLHNALPKVYSALSNGACKGDPRHIKLLLEHLRDIEEEYGKKETDISFTWADDDKD